MWEKNSARDDGCTAGGSVKGIYVRNGSRHTSLVSARTSLSNWTLKSIASTPPFEAWTIYFGAFSPKIQSKMVMLTKCRRESSTGRSVDHLTPQYQTVIIQWQMVCQYVKWRNRHSALETEIER